MPDMVVHACNPGIWEAEAIGSQVQSQPGLHNKALSQKNCPSSSTYYQN
jgi:hypothetical protein